MLEAAGIPRDGFDPKRFKIILVSKDKELLLKMGAKQPIIPIGIDVSITDRWMAFINELDDDDSQKAFPTLFLQQQQEELPAFDSNTDHNICSFLEPETIMLNNIMKALRSHQHYDVMIGIIGPTIYMDWFFWFEFRKEVIRLSKEENLFDEETELDQTKVDTIQGELEIGLGITSRSRSSETAAGLRHEKAQGIRQTLLSITQKKRLLLLSPVLDREIDLEAVGIPLHDGVLEPKFFKIILFSYKIQVLQKMGAQQVFDFKSIESSKKRYKWWRILDGYLERSDFRKLADECGSTDLANLLAKKLKGQGMHAWANAFRRLKESPFEYEERKKVIDSIQCSQHTPSTS